MLEASIFAEVEGQERQVLIKGRLHQNRAMQGDAVVIELLPKAEWAQGEEEVALEEDDETHMTMAKEADADVRMFDATDEEVVASSAVPCAKVVGILRRAWRPLCGIVDAQSAGRAQEGQAANVLFIPVDRRLPRIRIRTRQGKQLLGKRIAVAVDGWARSSKYPAGHYIRTIGDIGDRETETEVLLLEHDVAYAPFSQHVLRCLPPEAENYRISDEELAARRDLRDLDVCSIDPPGCTDIDDALHCRPLPNGNLEVGVHIADVGHFVMPGNAMDEEAARRGTTVYLVDRRIDMLPSLLGTNLCSLRCNVDRLAFSCIWELTPDAKIVGVTFSKSVIHSKASLTYEEAQARIEDISRTDPLTVSIRALNALAKKLRAARIARGALTLASPEVRFRLENDSQDPLDVELKELKETNALVEEFMLLANISVAKQIFSHFPDFSLLRRHPSPSQPSFDPLKKALSQIGLSLDTETSKTLADSLDVAALPDDPYFNKLLRIMTTRCMMQAVYFCSGKVPENEFWHYGLATEIYTHFTSPIRRYAGEQAVRL